MEAKAAESGMTDKMIAEKDGVIGWMIFNQPEKHNAVSYEMWAAVPDILEDFAQDDDIRVVVLKGAGKRSFISGADISQFEKNRSSEETTAIYNAATEKATKTLETLGKPTIAMINGYCIGGGCSVAISCDLRIAADFSTFAIPAAKLGLGYGYGGVKKLVDLVGPSYTKEIFYTARQFSAEEAQLMGLINRVVPKDQLESYVREYAGTIGGNAPMTIRTLKATVAEAVTDPERRDLGKISRMIEECFASGDYKEGRTAFMEKRKPQFRNR
jgi:enoyl-CoA hydratase/carnithine racemase